MVDIVVFRRETIELVLNGVFRLGEVGVDPLIGYIMSGVHSGGRSCSVLGDRMICVALMTWWASVNVVEWVDLAMYECMSGYWVSVWSFIDVERK